MGRRKYDKAHCWGTKKRMKIGQREKITTVSILM